MYMYSMTLEDKLIGALSSRPFFVLLHHAQVLHPTLVHGNYLIIVIVRYYFTLLIVGGGWENPVLPPGARASKAWLGLAWLGLAEVTGTA